MGSVVNPQVARPNLLARRSAGQGETAPHQAGQPRAVMASDRLSISKAVRPQVAPQPAVPYMDPVNAAYQQIGRALKLLDQSVAALAAISPEDVSPKAFRALSQASSATIAAGNAAANACNAIYDVIMVTQYDNPSGPGDYGPPAEALKQLQARLADAKVALQKARAAGAPAALLDALDGRMSQAQKLVDQAQSTIDRARQAQVRS